MILLCASRCVEQRAMNGAMKGKGFLVLAGMILVLLAGCSAQSITEDGAPSINIDVSKIPNAVPRPYYGALKSSPYQLAGISYQPIATSAGFRQEGVASWYGTKFQGRKTANGETYDLYAMTAAHKTLPLPSYVRVINKANGRSVVVRVNDRGPFHDNRIVDLSYAAAKKLGFQDKGTASVVLEGIETFAVINEVPQLSAGRDEAVVPIVIYVQVAALSSRIGAEALQKRLQSLISQPVLVTQTDKERDGLYRVRVGPLVDRSDALKLGDLLADASFERVHLVFE
ncbi:MAG: septal ring lytic transglycosylase RlpA family protein [Endozoicomonadaceae bacterium]|nr:septal ring lytic transglycosylase RlpA family protein [Endozoicomonadaceae bacterium]